ncbi:MAG: hypothetical protein ABIH84_00670 [bacterium]
MRYILWLTFLAAMLIRWPEIARPLWTDEVISINTLTVRLSQNPLFQGITTNLPLYFWLLSAVNWLSHLQNVKMLRLLGIIINLLTGWLIFRHLAKEANKPVSIIFLLIFLFAPLQIHYSAELRPYALSQLWCALYFICVQSFSNQKRQLIPINLIAIAGLFTHYSFYLFFGATIIYLLIAQKKLLPVWKLAGIPAIFALFLIGAYFTNPLFNASLTGLKLKRETAPLGRLMQFSSLSRVKEVVTNYYYYGLYYYRQDPWAQTVIKKILLIVLGLGSWSILSTHKTKFRSPGLAALAILLLALGIALIGEKVGYYPFGGRHIMPFSFLLYIVAAYGLVRLWAGGRWGRAVSGVMLLLILSSFITFQVCGQLFNHRYTGTNDPQGDIYGYCLGNFMIR